MSNQNQAKSFINEESSNLVQKIQEGTLEKYPELNKKQVKSFSFVMFLTNRAISRMLYLFKDINCMEGWIIQIQFSIKRFLYKHIAYPYSYLNFFSILRVLGLKKA